MQLPLHYREYGDGGEVVVLLHGLFGSSANWGSIARELAETYRVIVPDLRNHGQSPHADRMHYVSMAGDLLALLDRLSIARVVLVGHSMGGKVAMHLALTSPQRVTGLAVVDIAPVAYAHDFSLILEGLEGLDLSTLEDRQQADRLLALRVPERGVRGFLLQNLVRTADRWRWRVNLASLRANMPLITGFDFPPGAAYSGPTHFIYGELSDYVQAQAYARVRQLFPNARFCPVAQAGHWVYAEQRDGFMRCLREFLDERN